MKVLDLVWTTMEDWGESVQLNYGIFCLIPILIILALALWKKDTFLALMGGIIVAFLMAAKFNPIIALGLFMDQGYVTLCDDGTVWILLVCGLFGGMIALMTESGGILGFSGLAGKLLKSRKKTMIGTWILGIIVFVDDYLNCLAVGAAVRPLADEHRVSREMTAYIINSTGVTVCAIVPISTWGAFMSGLMEESGMTGGLSAFSAYCHAIPYMFYAIVAVIVVPLVCMGILPKFKNMRAAEERAMSTGETLSPESKAALVEGLEDEKRFEGKKCRAINFIAPIILTALLTILTEDMVVALLFSIVLCFILYIPQRLMNVKEFCSNLMKGLTDMFPVLVIIILAYMLIDVNEMLGLNDYVVTICEAAISPKLFPFIIFVGIGLLAFASGCFWSLAAIAFPIIAPVCTSMGIDPFLCAGAIVSAVAFGGHICLYSDTVILTGAATQVTNAEYFKTSAPIVAAYPFAIGAILFLVAGVIMC
ncbi:MAG: Na+/H+ antiporter NhaC family protein [Bacillota bacterium]|nr:Na+/H+ antiporter NhaC family protein [Bacillota bacterium]